MDVICYTLALIAASMGAVIAALDGDPFMLAISLVQIGAIVALGVFS